MKLLLYLAALSFPATTLAQRTGNQLAQMPESAVATNKRLEQLGSAGLRYPGGFTIPRRAALYRSLADTSQRKVAFWLKPGSEVFAVDDEMALLRSIPRWLRVARDTYLVRSGPPAGTDTTVYYLRSTAIADKDGTITRFAMH